MRLRSKGLRPICFRSCRRPAAGCPRRPRGKRARSCAWRIACRGSSWRARFSPRPAARSYPCRGDARCPGRATPPMPASDAPQWAMQRVDQRAVEIARRRMHHKPRLLVDDDEIGVLIDHIQRNILRLRRGGHGRRHIELIDLARFDPRIAVSYRRAVARRPRPFRSAPCRRERLSLGQGEGEKAVQPHAALIGGDGRAPRRSVYGGIVLV